MQERCIVVSLPEYLSDEAAYYFCEFFYELAGKLEGHYDRQIRSYYKEIESGRGRMYTPGSGEPDDCLLADDQDPPF